MNTESYTIDRGGTMNAESDSKNTGEKHELTDDERFTLLAHEQRRMVLEVLTNGSTPMDLDVLSTEIAVRKGDDDGTDAESIRRVTISLHHQHLPKMAEWGIVEYDPTTKSVEAGENLDRVVGQRL